MTIDEYAQWAATVAKVTADPGNEKLCYLGLGLSAGPGEVADHIKKLLRDGELDQTAMIEELGDVIYITGPASVSPPVSNHPRCWRKVGRRLRAGWRSGEHLIPPRGIDDVFQGAAGFKTFDLARHVF
jgi:hypothetical protein